jgi:DNA-binding response OmpR family regulator
MKVLVVEDEQFLHEALVNGLTRRGFAVDAAKSGKVALAKLAVNDYDLVLLDINLPDANGFDIAKQLRAQGIKTPLIAVTARDQLTDKISGFEIGFDDYLTKPFDFPELYARVMALIRRSKPNQSTIFAIGKVMLDPQNHKTQVAGADIQLTRYEFNILEYLMHNQGKVISYSELVEHVWLEVDSVKDPPLRSHIKNIRKKLGAYDIIKTIPGIGYTIKQ